MLGLRFVQEQFIACEAGVELTIIPTHFNGFNYMSSSDVPQVVRITERISRGLAESLTDRLR